MNPHYVVYLNKTVIDADNYYSTLNLDFMYTDFKKALFKFNELVKEEAEFISDLQYVKINDEIILVAKEEGKITKIKKFNMSN